MPSRQSTSAVSVRVKHLSTAKAGGQRRHNLRLGKQPGYVDKTRTGLNRVLIEPPTPQVMRARTVERRARTDPPPARALKANAAIVTAAIVTFGRDAQRLVRAAPPEVQDAAYLEIGNAIAARYDVDLLGAVVHCDESAPHCHLDFDCRTAAGKALSQVLKGSELQDIAAAAIRKHFPEITRGEAKAEKKRRGAPTSEIINRSVRQLHEDLPAEIAAAEAELENLEAQRKKLEGRVAGLREREELNSREEKRLQVYERRLDEKSAALDRLSGELHNLKTTLDHRDETLDERQAVLEARENEAVRRERQAAADMTEAGAALKEADNARTEATAAAAAAGHDRTIAATERTAAETATATAEEKLAAARSEEKRIAAERERTKTEADRAREMIRRQGIALDEKAKEISRMSGWLEDQHYDFEAFEDEVRAVLGVLDYRKTEADKVLDQALTQREADIYWRGREDGRTEERQWWETAAAELGAQALAVVSRIREWLKEQFDYLPRTEPERRPTEKPAPKLELRPPGPGM